MVIISKSVLNQFIDKYPQSAEPVLRWYLKCKESDWKLFADIKKVFPAPDTVGDHLYVFNVGGNKYRIIERIFFSLRTGYVRFIGTHPQYDKIMLTEL